METALTHGSNGKALVTPMDSFAPTVEQRQIIRDTYANGATDQEFSVLIEMAKARNLNPFLGQIWFVQRWDSQKSRMVWACQVSIDGLRAQAERTGNYAGQDEPEFEYEKDGAIKLARVKVYRKDWERPAVGVAFWSEYAAKKKDGGLTGMWAGKPHVMIAKCAEALALRKAFPQDTQGLYTAEEVESGAVRVEAQQEEDPRALERQLQKSVNVLEDFKARIDSAQTPIELEAIGAEIRKQPASIKAALKDPYRLRKEHIADMPPPDLGSPREAGEEG